MPILKSKIIAQGMLTLQISISQEELTKHLERASVDLQRSRPLAGFRPAKAPLTEARRAFGEMALLEESLKYAVPAAFVQIVQRENLMTIGEPEIQITKIPPAEPVEFTATIALLPEIRLGDYKSIREKPCAVTISDQEILEVIEEIRQMRAGQKLVDAPATAEDRAIIDLKMSKGGVPVEGGQATSHAIDLFKPYFIPGFVEKIIGLKADETKKFSLPFPKDHYNPALRGSLIDFEVNIKGVYKFERPALDDEFAAAVGKFANIDDLKKQIRKNLEEMKKQDEDARLERAIIEQLIKQASFSDIPQILLESELKQMAARLKAKIERDGGTWKDYLKHLNKTEEALTKEWLPEAMTRVKAALLMRAIGEAEGITVSQEEINAEQKSALEHYQDDHETQEYVKGQDYASHLKHLILTRKVMKRMKEIAT